MEGGTRGGLGASETKGEERKVESRKGRVDRNKLGKRAVACMKLKKEGENIYFV